MDVSAGESSHALPTFLGDDRHVVFFVQAESPMRQGAWLTSIDMPEDRVRLVGTDARPLYANGRIIYASDTAIVSQRIDLENRRLSGEVAVLGVGVGRGPAGQLLATASEDALIFAPRTIPPAPLRGGRILQP